MEYPKAIFGPNGEEVVVQDEAEEVAQLRAWAPDDEQEEAPVRRGPGRPRKVA